MSRTITTTGNAPTGEKLLATLIELYADQMGVKVEYIITSEKKEKTQ